MEMETPLPPETQSPVPPGEVRPPTDGLAARIATGETVKPTTPAAPKNKGGRPPTHGLYTKAAGSDGKKAVKPRPAPIAPEPAPPAAGGNAVDVVAVAAPPAVRVSVPVDLLKRVVRKGLEVGERFTARKLSTKAKAAGLTNTEIAPQLEDCRMADEQKETVADLTPLILEEWGVDPKVSPTLCALAILSPWAFANMTALNTLSELAKERLELLKRQAESQKTETPVLP